MSENDSPKISGVHDLLTKDEKNIDELDFLKIRVIEHPFTFENSNKLNEQIVDAINRMGGVGDDAETNYQNALNKLKENSKEVVHIIASEYRNLPKDRYMNRWALVQLLSELKDESSLGILADIISDKIPSEKSKDLHNFSTIEEVIIRTTAVEALVRIGKKNIQANELLLKFAQHEIFSIKCACILGYLDNDAADAKNTLLKILSESDHHILNIKRMTVQEVPQPNPEKHLVSSSNNIVHDLPPVHS